jgi:prepilin-type N-terminal cleavage/methylation domain-containing protein
MGSIARARLSRRARVRLAEEGGFTLPELLVSMAILLIVLTSLTSVLVTASRTQVDANKRFQAQGQARTGLSDFRNEVHCGTSVTDTSGNTLTPGTAYSAVTVTLGSNCPTTGLTSHTSSLTTYATWCTAASTVKTGDFALYRVSSTALPRPTCTSTGKVKYMDYLQPTTLTPTPTSTPFCLPSTTAACGGVLKPATSLPMLHVKFPLNLNGPTSTIDSYNLVDDIALRNGSRS